MQSFNELLQDLVNRDYDELVVFAQQSLSLVLPHIKAVAEAGETDGAVAQDYAVRFMMQFIGATIAADGRFTELEYKLFCDVLNVRDHSYEEIKELISAYASEEDRDLADMLCDTADAEVKGAFVLLAATFCAVDEKISADEVAFIKKLLE